MSHVFPDCGHEAKSGDFGMTGHFGCVIDRATKCPDCLGWERGDRVAMLKERIKRLEEPKSGGEEDETEEVEDYEEEQEED